MVTLAKVCYDRLILTVLIKHLMIQLVPIKRGLAEENSKLGEYCARAIY